MDSGVQAWFQIVLGAGLFVVGVGSLLDSTAPKMYVGAMIIGPIMLVRGLHQLQQRKAQTAAEASMAENAPRWPVASPEDSLRALAVLEGIKRVHENCQACGKEYVYFPEASAAAWIQFKHLGHAAAPCPRCGCLQPHMIDLEGRFATPDARGWAKNVYGAGIVCLVGSALIFLWIMMNYYGSRRGLENEWFAFAVKVEFEAFWWAALAVAVIAGIACVLVGNYQQNKPVDPNISPKKLRLLIGRGIGMPLEEYEMLAKGSDNMPDEPSTGIHEQR